MCILGLIVFVKLADWWFSSEGEAAPEALPGIPPPSRPPSPEDGIPAPSARDECAICGRKRTNPTAATSGYVFCYPCIFRHVQVRPRLPHGMHAALSDR
jgi:peroxin-12